MFRLLYTINDLIFKNFILYYLSVYNTKRKKHKEKERKMISYNKVLLIGNLTHDPTFREFDNGDKLCCFSIAVNQKIKDKVETDYVDIDAWAGLGEKCAKYLKKGKLVMIEGRLRLKKWKNAAGENDSRLIVVANVVQFLDKNHEILSHENIDNE